MKSWLRPLLLTLLVPLLTLLVISCSSDQEVGARYRIERELWQTNKEVRRLSLRPDLITDSQWREVAGRYERVVAEYGEAAVAVNEAPGTASAISREIRLLMARALINAAQVYAVVGDSIPMLQTYQRVATEFNDMNEVAVEVALARGQIAESRQEWAAAATHYQVLLDRLQPAPGEPGAAGALTTMPIRIARLRARDVLTTTADTTKARSLIEGLFAQARGYYDGWIAAQPGTRLELESIQQLASIATDLGNWRLAIAHLRALEGKMLAYEAPPGDPAEVRYALAMTQSRVEALADSSRSTLLALLKDYPDSPVVPQVLLTLAAMSPTEVALDYLDQLRNGHPSSQAHLSQGQLMRARVLEQDGRWAEAYEILRALPMDQPVSEVALQAPMEIIKHYQRVEDEKGLAEALSKAEGQYREFVERYPPGPPRFSARGKLIETLYLQKRYEDAIAELLDFSESMGKSPNAAPLLIEAAKLARDQLGDKDRAIEILERTVALHGETAAGRWAADEVARLQEASQE